MSIERTGTVSDIDNLLCADCSTVLSEGCYVYKSASKDILLCGECWDIRNNKRKRPFLYKFFIPFKER
jgi:hypothetical protein